MLQPKSRPDQQPPASYASLAPKPSEAATPIAVTRAGSTDPFAALFPASGADGFFAAEAQRLQAIKDALWQELQSGQMNQMISPIVAVADAYAATLSLQLKVMAYRRPKPGASINPRPPVITAPEAHKKG